MPKNILSDAEVKLIGYTSEKYLNHSESSVSMMKRMIVNSHSSTNAKHISALDVANLYKKRWFVELFFKWLKQHLKIKGSGVLPRMRFEYRLVLLSSPIV